MSRPKLADSEVEGPKKADYLIPRAPEGAAAEDKPRPQKPAFVRPDHAQDRELTTVAGGPRGWRKLSPLQSAYERGQLSGGNPKYLALQRFEAGLTYTAHWDISQSSGKNILDADRISCSGSGLAFTEVQFDALGAIKAIESNLSLRDKTIIRKVCGEGLWPSEAVALACGTDYTKATLARFREALDSLIEAIEVARHRRGMSSLRVAP